MSDALIATAQNETCTTDKEIVAASHFDSIITAPLTPVLLMCAEIDVFNLNYPEKNLKITAFVVSGSNRSYLTAELAALLDLPIESEQRINIRVRIE